MTKSILNSLNVAWRSQTTYFSRGQAFRLSATTGRSSPRHHHLPPGTRAPRKVFGSPAIKWPFASYYAGKWVDWRFTEWKTLSWRTPEQRGIPSRERERLFEIHRCQCEPLHCCVSSCPFEANTSSTVTLKPFVFLPLCLQNHSSRQNERALNSHQKSACACSPMTFSHLFVCVCVLVSVCVRAAFRWLLPPPAAPTQLQLPAERRSLLHGPGPPVWGESSWAATYCTFTQLNLSARFYIVIGQVWVMVT